MGKKIKDKEIQNPRNAKTLVQLYLYELLASLDDEINEDKIKQFFGRSFDNVELHPDVLERAIQDARKQLKEVRMGKFGNPLQVKGYSSAEWDIESS